MTDRDTIATLVKETLVREAKLPMPATELADTLSFNGDVSVNSLGFIRAVIALEDELEIETSDEALMQARFNTVGELVDFFVAAVAGREAAE
ncbi:MAG: acyl carrier protein [Hyphomicrobiales bacterium]